MGEELGMQGEIDISIKKIFSQWNREIVSFIINVF